MHREGLLTLYIRVILDPYHVLKYHASGILKFRNLSTSGNTMRKFIKITTSVIFLVTLFGLIGCSEEQIEKWDKARVTTGGAVKETAKDVKEGVNDAVRNAKPTDPDTGEAIK